MRDLPIAFTPHQESQARERLSASFTLACFAAESRGTRRRQGCGQGRRMRRPNRCAPGQSASLSTGSERQHGFSLPEDAARTCRCAILVGRRRHYLCLTSPDRMVRSDSRVHNNLQRQRNIAQDARSSHRQLQHTGAGSAMSTCCKRSLSLAKAGSATTAYERGRGRSTATSSATRAGRGVRA